MTVGELIAQLRTIQDIFGDLPVWLEVGSAMYFAVQQVNYQPAKTEIDLPNRAELSISRLSTLLVAVSDSATIEDLSA